MYFLIFDILVLFFYILYHMPLLYLLNYFITFIHLLNRNLLIKKEVKNIFISVGIFPTLYISLLSILLYIQLKKNYYLQ